MRTITESEFADYHRMIYDAVGGDETEDDLATDRSVAECDRNWAALDGGRIVGAAGHSPAP